jgi:hypothetical protein
VTFCAQGIRELTLEAGFYQLFKTFLQERNISIPWTALDIAKNKREFDSLVQLSAIN